MESITSVSVSETRRMLLLLLRRGMAKLQKARPLEDRAHKPWEGIHRGTVGEASIKEQQPENRRQVKSLEALETKRGIWRQGNIGGARELTYSHCTGSTTGTLQLYLQ